MRSGCHLVLLCLLAGLLLPNLQNACARGGWPLRKATVMRSPRPPFILPSTSSSIDTSGDIKRDIRASASLDLAKRYLVATRPWSLSPTFSTSLLGVAVARQELRAGLFGEDLDVGLALGALAAVTQVHLAANLLNSIIDYHLGVDTPALHSDPTIAGGILTLKQAKVFALLTSIGAAFTSAWVVIHAPAALQILLPLFAVGAVAAGSYSAPPGLKYLGAGDAAVAIAWAAEAAFVYSTLTGVRSWKPVERAIPLILHTVAVLHANNARDISGDIGRGFKTLAARIGVRRSRQLYTALLGVPFLIAGFRAVTENAGYALPFASLPLAVSLARDFEAAKLSGLVERTAALQFVFGMLTVAAEVLQWPSLSKDTPRKWPRILRSRE